MSETETTRTARVDRALKQAVQNAAIEAGQTERDFLRRAVLSAPLHLRHPGDARIDRIATTLNAREDRRLLAIAKKNGMSPTQALRLVALHALGKLPVFEEKPGRHSKQKKPR